MTITLKILIVGIVMLSISCKPTNNSFPEPKDDYYDFNQTQFTFLVFNKLAIDTFFLVNDSLNYENKKLRKLIFDSLSKQTFPKLLLEEKKSIVPYETNTDMLDSNFFNIATQVISGAEKGRKEYFSDALQYLFYYKCLPDKFKYKWSLTSLGHFEFNATFFALLRDKSKELDDLIYGNTGYWDKHLQQVLKLNIYNEITAETARKIKHTIITDSLFNNERFEIDKTNFLEFLNNTIENKWRLILVDWD